MATPVDRPVDASARQGPWFRRHPEGAVVTAVLLFAVILTLRLVNSDPLDAVSFLYVFPISLLGITQGRLAGLVGGIVAVGLVGVWVVAESVDLSLLGWACRVLPLLLVGTLVGSASDQLERAAREREDYLLAVEQQREAVEINDTLVQGMSAAKWSLEAGRTEAGLQTLEETVQLGHQLVSDLIRQAERRRAGGSTGGSAPGADGGTPRR